MSELITKTKLLAFNKWSFGLATQNILLIYKFNIKNHSLIYLPLNFINYKYILNVYIYMYYLIIFLNTQTKLYSKSYKIIYLILSQPHKQLFLYFIFPNYARC